MRTPITARNLSKLQVTRQGASSADQHRNDSTRFPGVMESITQMGLSGIKTETTERVGKTSGIPGPCPSHDEASHMSSLSHQGQSRKRQRPDFVLNRRIPGTMLMKRHHPLIQPDLQPTIQQPQLPHTEQGRNRDQHQLCPKQALTPQEIPSHPHSELSSLERF